MVRGNKEREFDKFVLENPSLKEGYFRSEESFLWIWAPFCGNLGGSHFIQHRSDQTHIRRYPYCESFS